MRYVNNNMAKYRWLTILSLSFIICHFSFSPVLAQSDRQLVRQGNKLYRSGDFANAEVSYRKALEKNDRNPQARYNLGNSLLAQNKDSAAVAEFEKAAKAEPNELRKSMAYHNMGVICQRHQMFGEAIEAYKQSLRLNPKQKQQQQKQDEQKQQEQQKKQQEPKMSKDNAEQLLNAAMQQEKQTQERMKKAQQKPQKRNIEKNW